MDLDGGVPGDSKVALSASGDPWLLTPGPLTTSLSVKQAMLHDYGSRDRRFIELNRWMRDELVKIVADAEDYTCVPLQGSGTFVVEAMLTTLLPPDGKALVLINGAYGKRIAKILDYQGRDYRTLEYAENEPVSTTDLMAALAEDTDISHVVVVHCETTTGILNPLQEVAELTAAAGRALLIDAMSALGAIRLNAADTPFQAVAASSNKCLQGPPGMGFCIVRKDALAGCEGNCDSLSLDLHDQWTAMEKNAQWRFTPPVQVIAAFCKAIEEFLEEGGVEGRHARYAENCSRLIDGMRELGFTPLLSANLQAPIIVTFLMPDHANFEFQHFYDALSARGYVIYPGKLTVAETFRIGCIGDLGAPQIDGALAAIAETLQDMAVQL